MKHLIQPVAAGTSPGRYRFCPLHIDVRGGGVRGNAQVIKSGAREHHDRISHRRSGDIAPLMVMESGDERTSEQGGITR
jgi:hypothetical protein